MNNLTTPYILYTDDDPDDRMLAQEAFDECQIAAHIHFVSSGIDALKHLQGPAPKPQLIMLDLNMPKMDGRQTLQQIKDDPALQAIPVIILTTANSQQDIDEIYQLGANAYLIKPTEFEPLTALFKTHFNYWLNTAKLPTLP